MISQDPLEFVHAFAIVQQLCMDILLGARSQEMQSLFTRCCLNFALTLFMEDDIGTALDHPAIDILQKVQRS